MKDYYVYVRKRNKISPSKNTVTLRSILKEADTDIRYIQFKSLVYPGSQGHPILMISE